jgi:hypothetical protein
MHRVLLDVPVCASLAALALVHGSAVAQSGGTPASLTTPDYVGTRIGALEYWDGVPSEETAERVRDTLDFTRALNVFNNSFRGASAYAIRKGLHDAGAEDNDVVIFSDLMDSSSLFLTANADTVYYMAAVDLSKGPMVIEQPPDGLGTINDMWFSWVIDIGSPGPDRGEGGRYLLVPPGHEGPLPDGGFFVAHSKTNHVLYAARAEQGLVHDPASLQPARALLHQGVEAVGDRAGLVTGGARAGVADGVRVPGSGFAVADLTI